MFCSERTMELLLLMIAMCEMKSAGTVVITEQELKFTLENADQQAMELLTSKLGPVMLVIVSFLKQQTCLTYYPPSPQQNSNIQFVPLQPKRQGMIYHGSSILYNFDWELLYCKSGTRGSRCVKDESTN